MKKTILKIASLVVAALVAIYCLVILKPFSPAEAVGTVVSINSFTGEQGTTFGIDTDNDGKSDLEAWTNEVLGRDIIQQCCNMHEEATDVQYMYDVKMFTPVKVKVIKVVMGEGNFLEKHVPSYLIMKYGKQLAEK